MKNISFVITSDPQYPWTLNTDLGISESDSDKKANSEALIRDQYTSINNYVSDSKSRAVVLVNGDLTAFGHGSERSKIAELLNTLNSPWCWGLGNHDIQNNYLDTANNGAATDMMRMFIEHYNSLTLENKSWDVAIVNGSNHVDYTGSFNYSWDEGDFHFMQLNNFPGMTGYDFNKTIITTDKRKVYMRWDSNLTWIKKSLAGAINRGKFVIINVHKPDQWPTEALNAMKNIFSEYKNHIKAIFSGHYHGRCGYQANYTQTMGGNIPVFLSGSASRRTYLIMETDPAGLNIHIYLVRENNWKEREMIYTIPLRNSVDNIVIKPEINLKKAMTADLGNKAALFDSFELPEQLYTITRNSIDKNAFTIRKSFNVVAH